MNRKSLLKGLSLYERGIQAYKLGQYSEAYTVCREGLEFYRIIQAKEIERAEASMVGKELSLAQKRHTNIYFSLPRYYASLKVISDVKPGQLKQETLSRISTLLVSLEQ